MKKFLLLAVAVVCIVCLVACAQSGSDESIPNPNQAEEKLDEIPTTETPDDLIVEDEIVSNEEVPEETTELDATREELGLADGEYMMSVRVLEIRDTNILVEPVDDEIRNYVTNTIEIDTTDVTWSIPSVGEIVNVVHDGHIQESNPATLNVFRVELSVN